MQYEVSILVICQPCVKREEKEEWNWEGSDSRYMPGLWFHTISQPGEHIQFFIPRWRWKNEVLEFKGFGQDHPPRRQYTRNLFQLCKKRRALLLPWCKAFLKDSGSLPSGICSHWVQPALLFGRNPGKQGRAVWPELG